MECPMCKYEIGEPPFKTWEECPNCDWNINHAIWATGRIAQLEAVKDVAKEFVNQSENVHWRGINPQLGDGKTSIDIAYRNLKLSVASTDSNN